MIRNKIAKNILIAAGGGIVGLINGLLGGGGGTFVVPLYETIGDMQDKKAHATAIATILPLSIASGAVYLANGSFPVESGLYTTLGVVLGGIIGALLLKIINTRLLSLIFYGIMIYAGGKMLIG